MDRRQLGFWSRRLGRWNWAVLFPVLWLVSCHEGEDPAVSRGSLVVIGVEDETALLLDDTDADFLFFSSLVDKGEDGKLEPRLATAWNTSPDGRIRTWHLRSDVRWHDGRPLTAHDVKFTFDLLRHPEVAEYRSYGEVKVLDDFTFQIEATRHNYGDDIVIYPRHLLDRLEKAEFRQWDFWMQPVGSGPYRFSKYVPNHFMELEANTDYYRGKPQIERLQVKFVSQAGITEALRGNIDILYPTKPGEWLRLGDTNRFRVVHEFHPGMIGLYLNHRHPLFSDSRVRRAIGLALNRPAILEAIGLPTDLPLPDVISTVNQFRRRQWPPPLPYDPIQAAQLLDDAGWVDQDGDGIREKDGVEARFSLIPRPPGDREVLIQEFLRQVGLEAEIESLDIAVVWDRMGRGEFEAAVHIIQANQIWHDRYFGRNSVVGYSNERVAVALERALLESRDDARDKLYDEIQHEFERDRPVIPLHPFTYSSLVHRRIKGLEKGDPVRKMDDLWVEELSK